MEIFFRDNKFHEYNNVIILSNKKHSSNTTLRCLNKFFPLLKIKKSE